MSLSMSHRRRFSLAVGATGFVLAALLLALVLSWAFTTEEAQAGSGPSLSQSLRRPITTDDLRPPLSNKDPIMALATREIQHRPRQVATEEVDKANKER